MDPIPVPVSSLSPRAPSSSPPANGRRSRGTPRTPRAQHSPPPPNNCVVLKNLDYNISQQELEEVVRRVAGGRKEFINLSLIDDKATGQFRGMAFVNFHSIEDATNALAALSKMSINNRKVVAEFRRLRPGEKRFVPDEHRRRVVHSRTTFERDVPAEDADGNALDKRRAFFNTRDSVRRDFEKHRAAEKADREREREAEFRARLLAYRDDTVDDADTIDDIAFENDLTSYERRMVHVICDEIGLGHMSVMKDDGTRVLMVTKHPKRMTEWAELTADIRRAANERKGEEKRKRKEEREQARLAAANVANGKAEREQLEGIKWFKPRSAKVADGEDAAGGIKAPQYKIYVPPRQPAGPDGTVGFHRRKPYATETDGLEEEQANGYVDDHVDVENGLTPDITATANSGETKFITTPLDPSVPPFTPSAAYAT